MLIATLELMLMLVLELALKLKLELELEALEQAGGCGAQTIGAQW
jgi:hypothetical protein